MQEYIARVDPISEQEEKNESSDAQAEMPAPEEKVVYNGFNLNQPGMPEAEADMRNQSANLINPYQFQMPYMQNEMMYGACVNSNQPAGIPDLGMNLSLNQLLALNSDAVNPVGSFTELLGLGLDVNNNMYTPAPAPQLGPWGRFLLSHNIGPVYFGDDAGCSSSTHGAPMSSDEYCYKNMGPVMSSEKATVDVKGKGKMYFLG